MLGSFGATTFSATNDRCHNIDVCNVRCVDLHELDMLPMCPLYHRHRDKTEIGPISTGALYLGWKKMQKADFFSGYISGLPLIEHVISPQKSPLRVLHNLHIN